MGQTTRDSHTVAQWYLKPWTNRSGELWRYRLLVSRARVPAWDLQQPKGIAYLRDIYTSMESGTPTDEFERWLTEKFELPAQVAIDRVLKGLPLGPDHWQHLGRFAVSQRLRTVSAYIQWQKWAGNVMDAQISRTLNRSVAGIAESNRAGRPLRTKPVPQTKHLERSFAIDIDREPADDPDKARVGVRMLLDRETWMGQQRHVADGSGWMAALQNWTIVAPAKGFSWFTSDAPVVMVSEDGSNTNVGWKSEGAHIMLPLSPVHLLYTQVGRPQLGANRLTPDQTRFAMAAQAGCAHMAVFAASKAAIIPELRPRVIDHDLFQQQAAALREWHSYQTTARQEFDSLSGPCEFKSEVQHFDL